MNNLLNYSVKVGSGSGCLYKVHTTDYTYVLTAKHNIKNGQLLEIFRQRLDDKSIVIEEKLIIIGDPYLHPDPNKDAAIIKVAYVDDLDYLSRQDEFIITDEIYTLFGHPDSRKSNKFSYREDKLKIINSKEHDYLEAQITTNITYDEVVGHSGGGIVSIDENEACLLAIQSSMSASDNKEMLSRIDCMPLNFYDEIVESNSASLVQIIPSYLECFSNLKAQAMPLVGCFVDTHISFTREFLRSMTDKIVSNKITPKFIKDFFKKKLLMYNQNEKTLNEKGLWLCWLELLIVMNIYKDGNMYEDNLEELFNTHRLIFSNTTEDWSTQLENIVRSDFLGLKSDGKIVVGTNSVPRKSVIPAGIVLDIVRGQNIPKSELRIDEAVRHPLVDYKLIHIHAFQDICIINKSADYKDYTVLDEEKLIEKLKNEYEELFR